MTFQRHGLFESRQALNTIAVVSGLGVTAAAILFGAGTNARTSGNTQCVGVTQEYVEPGTPVDQVIQDIAGRFGVDSNEYRAIFLQDNRGTDGVFVQDYNNTLVVGNGTVNVADSCS